MERLFYRFNLTKVGNVPDKNSTTQALTRITEFHILTKYASRNTNQRLFYRFNLTKVGNVPDKNSTTQPLTRITEFHILTKYASRNTNQRLVLNILNQK